MKKKSSPPPPRQTRAIPWFWLLPLLVAALAAAWLWSQRGPAAHAPRGPVTFTRHVAPIIFAHCASCHRPGQAAPFPLLTYTDVSRRAKQVAEVTASRYMPPWLPVPGHGDFLDERRLSDSDLGVIQAWVKRGAPEGDPQDLPPAPEFPEGWQLGRPDLVVELPEAYTVPAEGRDVYRSFVIPIPPTERRFVRAIEFRPGNPKVVHHAFILFDITGETRRLDRMDAELGLPGIHIPSGARMPEGQFLSWQPGKPPILAPAGMQWPLAPRADLVLQIHLQPTGKPEPVRPSIGFYFTNQPPTDLPEILWLSTYDIDLPPGEAAREVKVTRTLMADVDLLSVLPHAHFLGKAMEGTATLPDGSKRWLIHIADWNFNWQGEYRLRQPMFLPRGTVLTMRYTYDNSAANPRNPHTPPRRVQYGLQSTDEMAELWLQVRPRSVADRQGVLGFKQAAVLQDTFDYNRYLLRLNPGDARAQSGLGKAEYFSEHPDTAAGHFQRALELDATLDEPHYYLGLMHRRAERLQEAQHEFEAVLAANPEHAKAHGNLGYLHLEAGKPNLAGKHFREALRLNPDDTLAREGLRLVKPGAQNGPPR